MKIPELLSFRYDKDVDAAYAKFTSRKIVESIPLDDDFIVDVDEDGEIVGIEVLNYSDYGEGEGDYLAVLEHVPESGSFHFS